MSYRRTEPAPPASRAAHAPLDWEEGARPISRHPGHAALLPTPKRPTTFEDQLYMYVGQLQVDR